MIINSEGLCDEQLIMINKNNEYADKYIKTNYAARSVVRSAKAHSREEQRYTLHYHRVT